MRRTGLLAVLLASLPACLDVADERAARDARIGRADHEALAITVEGGLAHVRALEAGDLTLWGQAPAIRARLEVRQGGAWRVTLRNAMADARLCVTPSDGLPVCPDPVETPLPTEKTWALDLTAGATYSLDIGPPDAAARTAFQFVVYADVQDRIDGVQDIYRSMAKHPGVRFGLISGDLTEQGTPSQLDRFQREMRTLPFPCFATLGNHELGTRDDLFQAWFGRANFTFDFHGVRFTLLDSASATLAPRVHRWLDGWLDTPDGTLHLVMMHIPPLDPSGLRNGGFASRAEAMKLLSTLARGGVDLTIYGHVHTYSTFSNAGIEAHITGGGGAIPQRFDGIGRHYLLIDADPVAERFRTSVVRVHPEE